MTHKEFNRICLSYTLCKVAAMKLKSAKVVVATHVMQLLHSLKSLPLTQSTKTILMAKPTTHHKMDVMHLFTQIATVDYGSYSMSNKCKYTFMF